MAETRSPLAGRAPLAGRHVTVGELPLLAKLTVRARDTTPPLVEALSAALGAPVPAEVGHARAIGPRAALCLAPGEWRVTGPAGDAPALADALGRSLPRGLAAVVDVSDACTTLAIEGAGARDLIGAGCPLDLHPRAFGPGRCAQSLLAKAEILLHQTGDAPAYRVEIRWSLAAYLWDWLADVIARDGL